MAGLRFYLFWFWIVVLVGVVALLLSLAGIYAVMSFSVSRRTREIGVRVALGAGRGRVIAAIFRRPLAQLGLGLAVGCVLVVVLYSLAAGSTMTLRDRLFIAVYMLVMTAICLLACVVPTRRALAVEPMAALRSE
jgi:putative ABC transport system permease protein